MLLKKILLSGILFTGSFHVHSQADYQDQYIGWIKMYSSNEPSTTVKYDHRSFSAKQMGLCNTFRTWMQASYTPKGSLGDAIKVANDKLGLYNQNTKAMPNRYGANSKTYIELKKNKQGKYVPETNSNWFWHIMANGQIGDMIDVITTPEQYYFYIPNETNYSAFDKQSASLLGFNTNPRLQKYISYFQPKGIGTTLQYVVLLCKDNQRPYVQITRGEFLEQLSKAIERHYAEKKQKINSDAASDARGKQKFLDYEKGNYDRRIIALNKLKEKHKNKLGEKAAIYTEQPSIFLENELPDMFEGGSTPKIPVYKYDPEITALCKTDTPQWIVIAWDAEGVATSHAAGIHLHQSILSNFNFDYVYNTFFDPAKVKGIPYKPLQSPTTEEKIGAVQKSITAKQAEADGSVLFFEDFSNTPEGRTPLNWNSSNNSDALKARVEKLAAGEENWVVIKGHRLTLKNLPKKTSPNFTASFDVAVPQGFTWGAKALEFWIVDEKTAGHYNASIKLRIRPGFDGTPGFASLETASPGSTTSSNQEPVPGFSNNKSLNRVRVSIKKSGEQVQVFINQQKIIETKKAVLYSQLFNQLFFYHISSDTDTEKYYLTNIKITYE